MIHTKQEYRIGDCVVLMQKMDAESVDMVFTSPPYWGLRDYGVDGQIGIEPTLNEYHERLLDVTAECMRVLKSTGVMFWVHGDSYGGGASQGFGGTGGTYAKMLSHGRKRPAMVNKCLTMQNERLAMKMTDQQGWILRDRIIWAKKVWTAKTNKTTGNCMPGSQSDRCTFSYEPVYMFVKNQKYWSDMDAIRTPYTEPLNRWGGARLHPLNDHSGCDEGTGQETYRERDMRPNVMGATSPNVWQINTKPYTSGLDDVDHFAAFPPVLVERLLTAFCPPEICSACGHIRERIVERDGWTPPKEVFTNSSSPCDELVDSGRRDGTGFGQKYQDWLNAHPLKTIGWTTCDCGAKYITGTVCDPFAGSGTVGEVARKLNRDAILLELNPDYGRLISKRIMEHTPPLSAYFPEDE